jgi:hypothetical protein
VQIDGFIDKDEFKKQIDEWINVCRNTKPAPGTSGPLIPGDPEREAEAIRSKEGIPLIKPSWTICWIYPRRLEYRLRQSDIVPHVPASAPQASSPALRCHT